MPFHLVVLVQLVLHHICCCITLTHIHIHIHHLYIIYFLCVQGFIKKIHKKNTYHFLNHDHLLYLYKWPKNNSKLFFKYIKYNIKNTYIYTAYHHQVILFKYHQNPRLSSPPILYYYICILE